MHDIIKNYLIIFLTVYSGAETKPSQFKYQNQEYEAVIKKGFNSQKAMRPELFMANNEKKFLLAKRNSIFFLWNAHNNGEFAFELSSFLRLIADKLLDDNAQFLECLASIENVSEEDKKKIEEALLVEMVDDFDKLGYTDPDQFIKLLKKYQHNCVFINKVLLSWSKIKDNIEAINNAISTLLPNILTQESIDKKTIIRSIMLCKYLEWDCEEFGGDIKRVYDKTQITQYNDKYKLLFCLYCYEIYQEHFAEVGIDRIEKKDIIDVIKCLKKMGIKFIESTLTGESGTNRKNIIINLPMSIQINEIFLSLIRRDKITLSDLRGLGIFIIFPCIISEIHDLMFNGVDIKHLTAWFNFDSEPILSNVSFANVSYTKFENNVNFREINLRYNENPKPYDAVLEQLLKKTNDTQISQKIHKILTLQVLPQGDSEEALPQEKNYKSLYGILMYGICAVIFIFFVLRFVL